MSQIKTRIRAKSENPTKTIVKASGFTMIIDEPEQMEGTNEGATPVEFLLGAFSGCLNVVAHVVAKEMNFEFKNLEIEITGNLDTDKLMGVETDKRAGFTQIDVKIKMDTDADSETLNKWVKTMEQRCPISDNIQHTTPVSIKIA